MESPSVFWLLAAALFTGSIGGLVVASILKYLDNIVKEYSGSVANIMTALGKEYKTYPIASRFAAHSKNFPQNEKQ